MDKAANFGHLQAVRIVLAAMSGKREAGVGDVSPSLLFIAAQFRPNVPPELRGPVPHPYSVYPEFLSNGAHFGGKMGAPRLQVESSCSDCEHRAW